MRLAEPTNVGRAGISTALALAGCSLVACKEMEHDDASSSSQTSHADSQSESTLPTTGGAESSTGATGETGTSSSTGSSGGVCQGPEHDAFLNALCPFKYPDCTPNLPEEDWAAYCMDSGFGPVGSGQCGCTPKAVSCATGPDTSSVVCCCPLEDVDLDP